MKRILYLLLLAMLVATGCTTTNDTLGKGAVTDENVSRDALAEKDRIIIKLEKELNAIKERTAKAEQPAEEAVPKCPEVPVTQDPVLVTDYSDYQKIDRPCYSVYIPKAWNYRIIAGELEFVQDRLIVGNTEVLQYLNREAMEHYIGNHVEQTGFKELEKVIPIKGTDIQVYQIRLLWTKPAADMEPNWKYDETKVFIAIKDLERSFGFYFSTVDVPEATIDKIIRSFRLN
ncbi:hypothetical protein KZ483_03115 [Paenibacillus sp. sptzw28]|uniref:hypothetical protein n=1 Tax=Paenibacillus sp. sptzw28 TaxID=715179 RepID=UPI001C6E4B50|nr:hypothetical protein [Paenibacillus sp. sptzw28]QYR22034.1 hypothetical protein KZ483_03115 [Paenibacillus sp. sptzw28]